MKKILLTIPFLLATSLVSAQEFSPFLGFSVDGRTRLVVTDPSGDRTGNIGLVKYDESTNTELGLHSETVNITYTEPVLGTYQLDFKGLRNEQFRLRTIYLDPTGQYNEAEFTRWATADATTTILVNVSLDYETGTYVFGSNQLYAPTQVLTIPQGDQTTITWNDVASSTGYSVYYKYNDYPYYTLLTNTTATSTVADIPYATDSGDERFPDNLHYFRVTATLADGTETVMSDPVGNDDRDGDRIRDWIEINTYGTDPNDSDTDGDTIIDFLEINKYSTDPNDPDTDGDSYTDGEEVASSTNPLDNQSYPETDTVCQTDENGNWIVDQDCIIDSNTEVAGNITIFSNAVLSIQNAAQLMIDFTQHYIKIITGGTLEIEEGSGIGN